MNSSSKVPPRFVPTLTEVVQPVADAEVTGDESAASGASGRDSARDDSLGKVARVLSQSETQENVPSAARAAFHSSWLVDGLYVRSKPVTIPRQLPPLPESLPPQQPFAESSGIDAVAEADTALAEALTQGAGAAEMPNLSVQEVQPSLAAEPLPVLSDGDEQSTEPDAQVVMGFSAEETTAVEISNLEPARGEEQAAQVDINDLLRELMQRVDLVLEKRLKEVVDQVVEAQTRSLALRLREEVESVVRRSVYEAVEAELELQAQQNNEKSNNE